MTSTPTAPAPDHVPDGVRAHPDHSPTRTDHWISWGALGLLFFAPLGFGAVEPWAIYVEEVGVAVLTAGWLVGQIRRDELRVRWNPLFAPMLGFAVLTVVQIASGHTAYRQRTLSGLLLYIAYGGLAFLVAQHLPDRRQVRQLTPILCGYGFAIAAFAILQSITFNGNIYWLRAPASGGWIYGPYVNHNHYAGLMQMLVPIPLICSLSSAVHGRRKLLAAIAAIIMTASVFLSGSRGGMTAFVVQLSLLAVFSVGAQKHRKLLLTTGVFLLVVAAVLAWLGGGELASRIGSVQHEARTELAGGTRLTIARDSLRMFEVKPVLGWGLGTFPDVYPQFQSFYSSFFVNAAHNDYLQLLTETGICGFALMCWFLWILFRRGLQNIAQWHDDVHGAATLACSLGCAGILVHSLFDFNLQIPANAALFYALATVAASKPMSGNTHRLHRRRTIIAEGPPTSGNWVDSTQ